MSRYIPDHILIIGGVSAAKSIRQPNMAPRLSRATSRLMRNSIRPNERNPHNSEKRSALGSELERDLLCPDWRNFPPDTFRQREKKRSLSAPYMFYGSSLRTYRGMERPRGN